MMQDNALLRLSVFLGVLLLMMSLEQLFPKKQRVQQVARRWLTNLSLVIIGSLSVKLLGSLTVISVAMYVMHQSWGLLAMLPLPYGVDIFLGIILLDLAIYFQHVLSHRIPILWRMHRVHHADRDIDVTTGVRFHPLEILASILYKCCVILILGPVVISVVIFEILLNASAMFNHANLKLPIGWDRKIRTLVVTPDMHRVHHSVIVRETNSNYGFFLSIWDRLFKTYTDQPSGGHQAMVIGLKEAQSHAPSQLTWCLLLPFRKLMK